MSQDTVNHYEVLGIEASATTDEIKKAYRKKARELHPDINSNVADAEELKRVNHAYDVLSDTEKRSMYDNECGYDIGFIPDPGPVFADVFAHYASRYTHGFTQQSAYFTQPTIVVPEPEEFIYCGVSVCVAYDTDGHRNNVLVADLSIQLDDIAKLPDLPSPTHPVQKVRQVYLMDGDEKVNVVWADDSFQTIRREATRSHQQRELRGELGALRERFESLMRSGILVDDALRLHGVARQNVERMTSQGSYFHSLVSYDVALTSVRAYENELNRLESADPTELLVDGLMNGTLYTELVEHNREVLRQIEVFTIRSGGIWETAMDEDDLRAFYRKGLNGAKSLRDVWLIDLKLRLGDYVFEDESLTPEKLILMTRRGEREYDVHYSYREKTPTAAIEIPLSVFEQFAAGYGKKATFPSLGRGTRLWVSVRMAGDRIVSGWADDPKLIDRVDMSRKGQSTRSRR